MSTILLTGYLLFQLAGLPYSLVIHAVLTAPIREDFPQLGN